MSYDARERSQQDGAPIEIYVFELPGEVIRMTSYDQATVFDGETYERAPISRGAIPLVQVGKSRELTVTIEQSGQLAASLRRGGLLADALMTLRRFHSGDDEARQLFKGYVVGTSTEFPYVRLRLLSRVDDYMDVGMPIVNAQRTCAHRLYDRGCSVSPASFTIAVTIASFDGTELVVSSISGKPDHWARFGRVVHTGTGERRSVVEQVGTTITLDYPFASVATSDAVDVLAGCDLTVDGEHGCFSKFSNVINFGGAPEMPAHNPGAPTGFGVVVQV